MFKTISRNNRVFRISKWHLTDHQNTPLSTYIINLVSLQITHIPMLEGYKSRAFIYTYNIFLILLIFLQTDFPGNSNRVGIPEHLKYKYLGTQTL